MPVERHDQIVSDVACVTNICTRQMLLASKRNVANDDETFFLHLFSTYVHSLHSTPHFYKQSIQLNRNALANNDVITWINVEDRVYSIQLYVRTQARKLGSSSCAFIGDLRATLINCAMNIVHF